MRTTREKLKKKNNNNNTNARCERINGVRVVVVEIQTLGLLFSLNLSNIYTFSTRRKFR